MIVEKHTLIEKNKMDKKEKLGFMNFLKRLINIILFFGFSVWIYLLILLLQILISTLFWLFSKKSYSYYWDTEFWEYADIYGNNFWNIPLKPKT